MILMNLRCCIVIILFMNDFSKAKKHSRNNETDSSEFLVDSSRALDFRGNLRKYFYAVTALTNIKKNGVCSPLSAMMPLAKLALGAEGGSLRQLLAAIGLKNQSQIKRHFKLLISEMRRLPGVTYSVASKIYISDRYELKSQYQEKTKDIFDSSVESVNFRHFKSTANTINEWVSTQTKGNIKDMIKPSEISHNTIIIIVNAVFFRGKWEQPFKDVAGKFHTLDGNKVMPFMNRPLTYYNYTDSTSLNAKLVSIPYALRKAYFLIVLPNKRYGLTQLLTQLKYAPEKLNSAVMDMREVPVNLTMPMFKIESKFDLLELYKEVGAKAISERDSGLEQIVKDETIHVSDAKQKAFIEVNTEGTKAGAVSSTQIVGLSHKEPVIFYVGHPFLCFVIMDNQQLFSASVVDPTQ